MTAREHQQAGEIATAVAHHYRSRMGRGPTNTRAIVTDEIVVVTLEGMLTEAEAYLVRTGKAETVGSARRALYGAVRRELVPLVERATGRRVLAAMGDQHLELDLTVHVFMLDPADAKSGE
jgi:uncharacterized protein YbcI